MLPIPIGNMYFVQHCVKYQVFHISRASKCFIYLAQATVVLVHTFNKYLRATLCYIDLTQVYLNYIAYIARAFLRYSFRAAKYFIYLA